MDNDIDIEEHDLLDNPAIRKIFPDLSVLKSEVTEYFDEAPDIKQEVNLLKPEEESNVNTNVIHEENEEFPQMPYNGDSDTEVVFVDDNRHHKNKIILGSKPAFQCKVETKFDNITEKIYASRVVLEDVGHFLKKSETFCKSCCIFFPAIQSFKSHNFKIHQINTEYDKQNAHTVVYKCDKCVKTFTRHSNFKIHYQSAHPSKPKITIGKPMNNILQTKRSFRETKILKCSQENTCSHCNKKFISEKALIEHIYIVLRRNKKVSTEENAHRKTARSRAAKALKLILEKKPNIRNKQTTVNTKIKPFPVYKCVYCSYYFIQIKFYKKHVVNKHKDLGMVNIKMVPFDGQCKYCLAKYSTWKGYNIHLLMNHKEKVNRIHKINPKIVLPRIDTRHVEKYKVGKGIENTISGDDDDHDMDALVSPDDDENLDEDTCKDELIFKSLLFKCKRCDIHFLTARMTLNHADHMEMLINWKCQKCVKIFKKHDEIAHETQHKSNRVCRFTVVELDACQLERVLFKCSKCAIHFNEDNYLSHYKTCGKLVAESVYCTQCDFLIEKRIAACHFNNHKSKKLKPIDFPVLNSEVLTMENINKTLRDEKKGPSSENITNVTSRNRSYVEPDNQFSLRSSNPVKKTTTQKKLSKLKLYYRDMHLKLSYCEVCKCFMTLSLIRKIHLQARCTHLHKRICKLCGLVFTQSAIRGHQKLHQKRKDIKLQDFTFHDLRNGKQIIAPVPEYPKCYKCDVHFISKTAIVNHVCNDNDFLTCHICNISLSEPVFKLHMSFHYYSKSDDSNFQNIISTKHEQLDNKRKLTIRRNSDTTDDFIANSTSHAPTEEHSKTPITTGPEHNTRKNLKKRKTLRFRKNLDGTKNLIMNTSLVQSETHRNTEPKNNTQLVVSGNICEKMDQPTVMDVVDTGNNQVNRLKRNQIISQSDYELFGVLYSCVNCRTMIDAYDRVVEHCQNHLCNFKIETEFCGICKITWDKNSYQGHSKFHNAKASEKEFDLLTFDVFYFTLDISIWVDTVFGSISSKKTEDILSRSIYRKNKIKMRVIQDGQPDLTVYKCNTCLVIVDQENLLKHADTSCFKMRKFPCSICGLPFLSYLARQEHQTVHQARSVCLKSFRIIVFNHDSDKKNNKILSTLNNVFTLYQCRNCNEIVDKYQRSDHKCAAHNLKKCKSCNLFIRSSDYKTHNLKHENVPTFNQKNMKVVLFGQTDLKITDFNFESETDDQTFFYGTFVDYTFYQCVECEVCFDKSQIPKLKYHTVCYDNNHKSQCPTCQLYILKKKMPQHTKMHDRHDDFVRENMNIIPLPLSELSANFIPADEYYSSDKTSKETAETEPHKDQTKVQDTTEDDNFNYDRDAMVPEKYENIDVTERTAKLYKCICGLHFVNRSGISDHLAHCNPRIAKQLCSKCNLHFTPSVLFDHLLMHHGVKKYKYTFNVIEMSKEKCDIVTLFNCGYCNTHFVNSDKAKIHFEVSCEVDRDKKECKNCKLTFDISSIKQHESNHHNKSVADTDILDIQEYLIKHDVQYEARQPDSSSIDSLSLEADCVINSKTYNISEGTLSQLDLSKYDNSVYKCEMCNTHFLTESTLKGHLKFSHYLSPQGECHICGMRFSLQSLTKHIYIHHKHMCLSFSDFAIKYMKELSKE